MRSLHSAVPAPLKRKLKRLASRLTLGHLVQRIPAVERRLARSGALANVLVGDRRSLLEQTARLRAQDPDPDYWIAPYLTMALRGRLHGTVVAFVERAYGGRPMAPALYPSYLEALLLTEPRRLDGDHLLGCTDAATGGHLLACYRQLARWWEDPQVPPPPPRAARSRDLAARLRHVASYRRHHALIVAHIERACSGSRPLLGLMDYKTPDLRTSSRNLGDQVQTLAALRQLIPHLDPRSDLDQICPPATAEALRRTWPPSTVGGSCAAVLLDRDHPPELLDADGPPVWLIANGWYGCDTGSRLVWPRRVRPLFLSVHLARRHMLDPETLDYLRRFEPIGCRDWASVWWLLSHGVRAFFSGCLTLTLDLPDDPDRPPGRREVIDAPAWGRNTFDVCDQSVPGADTATNIARAHANLERLQRATSVTTSRLHCYLPRLALGGEARFVPHHRWDRRFDGLLVDRDERRDLAAAMQDRIQETLAAVAAGHPEESIYRRWATAWNDRVEEAQARFRETALPWREPAELDPVPVPTLPALDLDDRGAVLVALAFDRNLAAQVPTLVRSIAANCSRPVRFLLLTRGQVGPWVTAIDAAAGDAAVSRIDMDATWTPDPAVRLFHHISISTMDRLLIPLLLPAASRAVYIDIDTIVLGDVAELADAPTGSCGIAACDNRNTFADLGERLAREVDPATCNPHLMRRMCARAAPAGAATFNAGVLALDLARLRDGDAFRQTAWLAARWGLNDQDALNLYARGEHARLDPDWNRVPWRDVSAHPKLIHWVGPVKPWSPGDPLDSERWRAYADPRATNDSRPGPSRSA